MSSFVADTTARWTGKTSPLLTTFERVFPLILSRFTYKPSGVVFLFLAFIFFEAIFPKTNLDLSKSVEGFNLKAGSVTKTDTAFSEDAVVKTQTLSFKSQSVADASLTEGESKVVQAGVLGKKVVETKTIFHNGQKYSIETKVVSETKAVDEIIAVHPSVLEKIVQTPVGPLKYREKLRVWATSYDPFCRGCNSITSIGLKAGFGVVAVDPKVIPLRSKVYIPGYGVAIAGDTGGGIKGHEVDLGFDNVSQGGWSARYTDIYIISE